MLRFFEQPERRQRTCNGAYGVHQPLEAKGAPVSSRRNVRSKQGLLCGRANSTAKPRQCTSKENVIRLRRKGERRRCQRREKISECSQRLAAFQPIGVVASAKFCKTRKPVRDPLNRA